MSTPSNFPTQGQPLVDDNGVVTIPWKQFFYGLWKRTGAQAGVSATDAAAEAQQAFNLATQANGTANLANNNAQAAQITANSANSVANQALTIADSANIAANHVLSTALIGTNNLNDLSSAASSRVNLGVATFPVTFQFDTPTSGLSRYVPIARAMTVQAGLNATQSYCATMPTSNATFTLTYISGGTTNALGTVTLVPGTNTGTILGSVGAVTLQVGDTLALRCPSPNDATLASVGITIQLILG